MQSLLDAIRSIIGTPSFYLTTGEIDYGAVTEYFICGLILLVVISSVFRFVIKLAER